MKNKTVWDPGEVYKDSKLIAIMKLIRIEHTLFSLPFAYIGALALKEIPTLREIILIALALFGLRAASMAFNNIADLDIDKFNPRTKNRPLIRGDISTLEAWIVVIFGLGIYFTASALLNDVAVLLSPIPLLIVLTYPYAKRFHSLPHLHLGFSLGIVPIAGYIATVGDKLDPLTTLLTAPWLLTLAISFWVAGFDIVYAIMDLDFDLKHGVLSIPVKLGERKAVNVSRVFHILFIAFLLGSYFFYKLYIGSLLLTLIIAILLSLAHLKLDIREGETIKNFLNVNLLVGVLLLTGVIVDIFVI